jgi:hypothetical protein
MRRVESRCDEGEWRNWQTRYVQVVVIARSWRFKSSLAHQYFHAKTYIVL